uniref:Phosphatases II n=2 Tax=Schizophyllum commune (strain H4-8 / FGSC 9210) TaxID=578458 RepID=D8PMG2_SCHCM
MPPSTQPWLRRALTPEGFRQVTGALMERELSRDIARAQSREAAERERDPSIKPLTPMEAIWVDSAQAFEVKPERLEYYAVTVGCNPCNEQHNRYIQLEPYDRTRVTAPSADDPSRQRYLNASWVLEKFGGKWWIAAQAPLPNTSHAFLSLITEPVRVLQREDLPPTRVRTVVQLTQNMEGGRRKAHPYFPEVVGQTIIVPPEPETELPSFKVALVKSEQIEQANCVRSIISITPISQQQANGDEYGSDSNSAPIIFQHLLYATWPDHGVPEAKDRASLLEFARLVDETNRDTSLAPQAASDPDPPIIAGCSAGIGRTGSFIALSSLLRKFGVLRPPARTTPPSLAPAPSPLGPLQLSGALQNDMVAQEVDSLRDQRPGMVQRDEQILLIYEILKDALESRGSRA